MMGVWTKREAGRERMRRLNIVGVCEVVSIEDSAL